MTATGPVLSPAQIIDTLVIGQALALSLSSSSLVDTTIAGGQQPTSGTVSVLITGVGSGSTLWNATHGAGSWMTVAIDFGTGSGLVVWSRDASQLVEGIYIDTITVTASGSGVSPTTLVDTLVVAPAIALSNAADELFVGGVLSPLQITFLDALGNDDGTYNLGDVLAWVDWCQRTAPSGCIVDPAAVQQAADTAGGRSPSGGPLGSDDPRPAGARTSPDRSCSLPPYRPTALREMISFFSSSFLGRSHGVHSIPRTYF